MEIPRHAVEYFPDSVQLVIYKKMHQASEERVQHLAIHGEKAQQVSTGLTGYIHTMRDQTDVFLASEAFQHVVNNIPKLPKCAGSLSARLLDENVSAREVTESVQEEPALAASILKIVNSAYYGFPEKIASLHQAILYLGFSNVYQIVIEDSVKNMLPHDAEYEAIRVHSYVISLIAHETSARCQKSKPLLHATIGILHGIGKIVLLLLKKKYPNIKEIIDMLDDAKIGACLLRTWGFPEHITTIIEHQYDPEFTHPEHIIQAYRDELAILYLSHRFWDMLHQVQTERTVYLEAYAESLGLHQESYTTLYRNAIVPTLLKNKKRLPDTMCQLLSALF
jgi:HD-like signal output (HDOD) protein